MAAATAAISTAMATALYKYTYTLGRSLYVPLTSRCNSVTLPSTRGPGFALPRSVAEALVSVRNAEMSAGCEVDYLCDIREENDRVYLPPYDLPLVNSLYRHEEVDLPSHLLKRRQIIVNRGTANNVGADVVEDDGLRPSISTLVGELRSRLKPPGGLDFHQVVIAGEGEAMLRMDALLAVARVVQSHCDGDKGQRRNLTVRVITNGLCYGIANLGYSPHNLDRDGTVVPVHRHAILKDMLEAGITQLSVALNTANRHEYDILMEPCCHTRGGNTMGSNVVISDNGVAGESPTLLRPGTAHDLVCELIVEASKVGMTVVITGIDRPGIDKAETERLAQMLLSVRGKGNRELRSPVRWRRYFD